MLKVLINYIETVSLVFSGTVYFVALTNHHLLIKAIYTWRQRSSSQNFQGPIQTNLASIFSVNIFKFLLGRSTSHL